MEFLFRNQAGEPDDVISVEPEIIAGSRAGTRMTLREPHDVVFEFRDGKAVLESIDLVLYILPEEFFCYRGDELAARVSLSARSCGIDRHRGVRGVAPRLHLRPIAREE